MSRLLCPAHLWFCQLQPRFRSAFMGWVVSATSAACSSVKSASRSWQLPAGYEGVGTHRHAQQAQALSNGFMLCLTGQ